MKHSIVSRILYGLLFVALGIGVLLQVSGKFNFLPYVNGWWALIIIVPGVISMVETGIHFWNVFIVLLGCWLYADANHLLSPNSYLWFLGGLLIFFGIWVIAGGSRHRGREYVFSGKSFNEDRDEFPEYTCVFTNMNVVNRSQTFRGGKASAVFGKLVLDLREVSLTGHAPLEIAGVFGSVDVLLPPDVPLKVSLVPVFGSFLNRTVNHPAPSPNAPFLEIKGASVFGSVTII